VNEHAALEVSKSQPLASRDVVEVDLKVSDRTAGFACTSLIAEILAPEPLGTRVAGQQPARLAARPRVRTPAAGCRDCLAAGRTAFRSAGGMSSWPAISMPIPTPTRQVLDQPLRPRGAQRLLPRRVGQRPPRRTRPHVRPGQPPTAPTGAGPTAASTTSSSAAVRTGGATLAITDCTPTFDQPHDTASDHYGLVADPGLPRSLAETLVSRPRSSGSVLPS